MTVQRFISENQAAWEGLRQLLDEWSSRGPTAIPRDQVGHFAQLYRQAVSDLAYARVNSPGHAVVRQLEVLVGKAHTYFYRSSAPGQRSWAHFLGVRFPSLFRRTLPLTLAATGIFLVFAVVGYLLTLLDPAFADHMVPLGVRESIDRGEMWTVSINAVRPEAASGIATNNITVTLTTFALGITFGLGTVYMLAFNGLLMGAILAATAQAGMAMQLVKFVLCHGVLELPAIFISGAAGLLVGRAMLFPGRYVWGDEVRRAARTGSELVVGCIPILAVAGCLEAYLSPSEASWPVRMLVASLAALALAAYTLGRGPLRDDCAA